MKLSEMNQTQKKAYRNITKACNQLIGELENDTYDNPIDSDEYKQAKAELDDHKGLVETLYKWATTAIYDDGYRCFNENEVTSQLREINFCGTDWLMERCEERITKEGY